MDYHTVSLAQRPELLRPPPSLRAAGGQLTSAITSSGMSKLA